MKLIIKLENPKYCNGCPMLYGGITDNLTGCWYEDYKLKVKMRRGKIRNTFKVIRPKQCIKENGL